MQSENQYYKDLVQEDLNQLFDKEVQDITLDRKLEIMSKLSKDQEITLDRKLEIMSELLEKQEREYVDITNLDSSYSNATACIGKYNYALRQLIEEIKIKTTPEESTKIKEIIIDYITQVELKPLLEENHFVADLYDDNKFNHEDFYKIVEDIKDILNQRL